ncbi:Uncharacterised protein [Burkholderia pseudomallei]|nr:Uncharacterised protein [Burkholderia pseudomallei]
MRPAPQIDRPKARGQCHQVRERLARGEQKVEFLSDRLHEPHGKVVPLHRIDDDDNHDLRSMKKWNKRQAPARRRDTLPLITLNVSAMPAIISTAPENEKRRTLASTGSPASFAVTSAPASTAPQPS